MKFNHKTKWVSVRISDSGAAILSITPESCFYFETAEQLAEAISKKQIRVQNWIVSVPDSLCITKTIELPATDTRQAYQMLEFELSSHLPIAAEELVYGCIPVSRNENLLKVIAYILKIKTLEDVLAKFRILGIKPTKVMVDSVAVDQWFSKVKTADSGQMNLLFEKQQVYISAIQENLFRRHGIISFDHDKSESRQNQVFEEIRQFSNECFSDPSSLTLRIAANNNFLEKLKSRFRNDFKSIEFIEVPKLNSSNKNSNDPEQEFIFESIATQGLLKSIEFPEFDCMNLLPGKVLKKAQQRQLLVNAGISIVLGVLVIFGLWLNFAAMNWRIQLACDKLNREIAPIKHIAAGVESKRQQVRAIQTQLTNRRQISELFSQLYEYTPKKISINQMSYSAKADTALVSIKGQADTLSTAFEYSDVMKDSALLNNIQIINAQQIPKPGGSIVEFKAECSVRDN